MILWLRFVPGPVAAGYGRNTATALLGKIIISAIATIIIFLRCLGVFDTRDIKAIKKDSGIRKVEEKVNKKVPTHKKIKKKRAKLSGRFSKKLRSSPSGF